jgi:ketosteroid isomerase-like protein
VPELIPKKAAEIIFNTMNTRNLDRLHEILDPEAVFYFPGTKPLNGPSKIEGFLKILFRSYPRLEFTTGRVIAEANRAAVEWTNEGEDRKGTPYTNAGVTVVELRNGRIVYMSDTFKDTSFASK